MFCPTSPPSPPPESERAVLDRQIGRHPSSRRPRAAAAASTRRTGRTRRMAEFGSCREQTREKEHERINPTASCRSGVRGKDKVHPINVCRGSCAGSAQGIAGPAARRRRRARRAARAQKAEQALAARAPAFLARATCISYTLTHAHIRARRSHTNSRNDTKPRARADETQRDTLLPPRPVPPSPSTLAPARALKKRRNTKSPKPPVATGTVPTRTRSGTR